jgi:hypothetical protein
MQEKLRGAQERSTLKHRPCSVPARSLFVQVVFGFLILVLTEGCKLVQTAADVPAQTIRSVTPGKNKQTVDPVEVQQALFRSADEFIARMIVALERLKYGTNAIQNVQTLRWKITFASETTSIVSGPNLIANVLDLTLFVTATRSALEEHPQIEAFGDSAQLVLEACHNAETNLWRMVTNILTTEQENELRSAIEAWHRENPQPQILLAPRAVGFTTQIQKSSSSGVAAADSVFNLLKLDPLSGLDPAVRELTQTRLFADRALFVAQKMPFLLRWQTELLTINTVNLPGVAQLITNSSVMAASLDRFVDVAEALPGQVSSEREAIVQALEAQEKNLSPLVKETREALEAGTRMSTSLNSTIATFDRLMKRFGIGEIKTNNPSRTNSQPFRIQDYAQTATQLEHAALQLTELLVKFEQTLGSTNLTKLPAQFGPVIQQAESSGKNMADYTFWKCILIIFMVFVFALIYRFIVARFFAPVRSSTSSS